MIGALWSCFWLIILFLFIFFPSVYKVLKIKTHPSGHPVKLNMQLETFPSPGQRSSVTATSVFPKNTVGNKASLCRRPLTTAVKRTEKKKQYSPVKSGGVEVKCTVERRNGVSPGEFDTLFDLRLRKLCSLLCTYHLWKVQVRAWCPDVDADSITNPHFFFACIYPNRRNVCVRVFVSERKGLLLWCISSLYPEHQIQTLAL